MTASDCYQLGVILYNEKNYPLAIVWLEEANRQLDDSDLNLSINIQRHLSLVHLARGVIK